MTWGSTEHAARSTATRLSLSPDELASWDSDELFSFAELHLPSGAGSGLAPLAQEKVKAWPPQVEAHLERMLRAAGLPPVAPGPQPARPDARRSRADDGRLGSTPLSYLEVGGGHRLFMTQSLDAGAYKKFRLGMWDDGRPLDLSRPPPPVVALVELRLSGPNLPPAAPLGRPKTRFTSVDLAAEELSHLSAAHSPVQLVGPVLDPTAELTLGAPSRGVVEHAGKLYVSVPLAPFTLYGAVVALGSMRSLCEADLLRSLTLHTVVDVARSLAPMHAGRVLHRDLKLENFLVGEDGHISVGDLGHAIFLPAHRDAVIGSAGTVGHLAPEVLEGQGAGLPAEVWGVALAAVQVALHSTHIFADEADGRGGAANGVRAYQAFHRSLPRGADGSIALSHALEAGADYPHWAEVFACLARVSPSLAVFMLNRGLHPDPAQRARVAELERFAAGEMSARGLDPDGADVSLTALLEKGSRHHHEAQQLQMFRLAVRLAGADNGAAP